MAVNFTCTPQEQYLIIQIVARYSQMAEQFFGEALSDETKLEVQMDLTACHCNGCPLDLQRLLEIRDFDFIHDVAGIRNNIDRTTGKLKGFFLPRLGLLDNHARERLSLLRTLQGLTTLGWVCRRWWDSEESHDFPEDVTHEHIVEEAASVELCHLYFRKGEEKATIMLVWGNRPIDLIADVGGPAQFDTDLNAVMLQIWPNYPEE